MSAAWVLLTSTGLAWAVTLTLSRAPLRAGWAAYAAGLLYGAVVLVSYLLALQLTDPDMALGFYLLLCGVLWFNMRELDRFMFRLIGSERESLRASILLGLPVGATVAPLLRGYVAQQVGYAMPQRWSQYGLGFGFWSLWLWLAGDVLPLPWVLVGLLYSLLCYVVCFTFSVLVVVQFWLSARNFPRARASV